MKARIQEQKDAEEKAKEKAKELIETAEKVFGLQLEAETVMAQATAAPAETSMNVENEIHVEDSKMNGSLAKIPEELSIEDDYGNPFEERPPSSRSRKKSVETMDASTTMEDFYSRKTFNILMQDQIAALKSFGQRMWTLASTRPEWTKRSVTQMYIYTNTEEALDYIDDCAKFYFPMAFITMMLIYWTSYLYIIEDKLEMDTF